MKISREQIEQVLQALQVGTGGDAASEAPKLQVVGSTRAVRAARRDAERVKQICAMIAALPEVRPDRLSQLVSAVEHGDYDPSALDVAEKILGRIMADRLK